MNRGSVAYSVFAYHKPEQLLRLIGRLRAGSPEAPILLHYDARSTLPENGELAKLGVDLVAPRIPVQWGDFSLVEAVLTTFRQLRTNAHWRYVVVLSGQDYPLRPIADIEADLLDSGIDAFLDVEESNPFEYRYFYRYWRMPRIPFAHHVPPTLRTSFRRAVSRLNASQSWVRIQPFPKQLPWRLGIRRRQLPFSPEFPCRFGSDWFTLSRRAVDHVLNVAERNPKLMSHYRTSLIPSESFFATVLCNSSLAVECRDNRRFIVWPTETANHPTTLTMEHFEAMIASGKDFGRKFDLCVDSTVFDALDRRCCAAI